MDENTNQDKRLDPYGDRYEKGITELFEEKELKTRWHKEILENESIQQHFKNFHPASIDIFILFYLSEKYLAYKYADSYERMVEEKRSQWIDAAHQHLKFIQHKKLFDLQCLWRAEQITLDGVEIAFDFETWKNNILDCPFIEPISKDEIKMYQEFLLREAVDYRDFLDICELQNYEEFKENYLGSDDDGLTLPDWYEYHNLRTGNSALLLLPDIRGKKEDFYIDLCRKAETKNIPKRAQYVPDTRPFLTTHELEKVNFFVNTFEDEETRRKYANYSKIRKKEDNYNFNLDEILMNMEEEDELIPIEAHFDYKEALFKAYNKFRFRKVAEHMPVAHEQYLFNREMGFTTELSRSDRLFKESRETLLDMILDGRELNGEERNLEF